MDGMNQDAAAAASGMSVRTARRWQRGRLPSEQKKLRTWRTRADPFAEVWTEEIEPLLSKDADGALEATTVLEWLEERHPGRFSQGQLRTLQRRLRDWRALHGPAQDVKGGVKVYQWGGVKLYHRAPQDLRRDTRCVRAGVS